MKDETARKYLDAIVRMNQTDTADEIDVSTFTVNRYKHKFRDMGPRERNLLIIRLAAQNLKELDCRTG